MKKNNLLRLKSHTMKKFLKKSEYFIRMFQQLFRKLLHTEDRKKLEHYF